MMRCRTVCVATLWIAAAVVFAQQIPSTAPDFKWLQWDVEHLRSLGAKDEVGVATGITASESRELIRSLEAELRPSMKELFLSTEDELRRAVVENTRVEMIDLDGDGTAEVIVQGAGDGWGCSPTGNCPFWILQKTPTGYQTIVETTGQSFSVMKTRTNGFRDLLVGMHGSATSQGLKLYRYRSGRYFKAGCYTANWAVLVKGDLQDLKKPVITKCGH